MKLTKINSRYPAITSISIISIIIFFINRYVHSLEYLLVLKSSSFSWLSLGTAHFYHKDFDSLLINCSLLLLFGRKAEANNTKRILTLFFLSAIFSALFISIFKTADAFSGLEGGLYGIVLYVTIVKFKLDLDSLLDVFVIFPAVFFLMNWNKSHAAVFDFSANQVLLTEFGGALTGVIIFSALMKIFRK